MTCAGWNEVEALLDGELSGPRAGAAREHLTVCAPCAAEAAELRAERALFAARSGLPVAPPPPFADVLRRARRAERGPAWLAHPSYQGLGLAAAAAILGLFLARRPGAGALDEEGAALATAEPTAAPVSAACATTASWLPAGEAAPTCVEEERPATPAPPPAVAAVSYHKLVLGEDEGSCEPGCEGSCPQAP
jgi:anti-sigma factor RsiW